MDDSNDSKPKFFPLPYSIQVEGETSVRPKADFWRFRLFTSILRQSPKKIEEIAERYNK